MRKQKQARCGPVLFDQVVSDFFDQVVSDFFRIEAGLPLQLGPIEGQTIGTGAL